MSLVCCAPQPLIISPMPTRRQRQFAGRRDEQLERLERDLGRALVVLTGRVHQVRFGQLSADQWQSLLSELETRGLLVARDPSGRSRREQFALLARALRNLGSSLESSSDPGRLREELEGNVRDIVAALGAAGAEDVLEDVGQAVRRSASSEVPAVQQKLVELGEEDVAFYEALAGPIIERGIEGVDRALARDIVNGLRRGLSASDLAVELAGSLPTHLQADAYSIARTETTRFYNLGRVRGGAAARRYVWGYLYEVVRDSGTTDVCKRFDGRRVALEDLRFWPPLHWGCRTTLKPIMREGFGGPPGSRTDLPADAVPDPDFEEFRR